MTGTSRSVALTPDPQLVTTLGLRDADRFRAFEKWTVDVYLQGYRAAMDAPVPRPRVGFDPKRIADRVP